MPNDDSLPLPEQPMVIAIDGPAGAGKSTVTRAVAGHLGILYLDSGAMYRAATLGATEAGVDLADDEALARYVTAREISFDAMGRVLLDGRALGEAIRSPTVTAAVKHVADNLPSRTHLVHLQQAIVGRSSAVVEGRDATTVICPDAPLKIYLDASPEERARRRVAQWEGAGTTAPPVEQVVADLRRRDAEDMARPVGALIHSEDAVHLMTDGLSREAVVARIIALAVKRRPLLLESHVSDQLLVGRSRAPGYVRVAEGSIHDPPAPWKLGLTNPKPDRMPGTTTAFARNANGRQAGVLVQGKAVIGLAGTGATPGDLVALPMLPQSWYVLEPGSWHAVIQAPGTICAWAEAAELHEQRHELDAAQREVLAQYLAVYLPEC